MKNSNEYAVFENFLDSNQAKEFIAVLRDNNIDCKLVDNSRSDDIIFKTSITQNEAQVLVKQSQFETANELLNKQAENLINQVDQDHYLFDFTNEELYEILMKPDEWSTFDHKLAQNILNERGENVNDELVRILRKKRNDELTKPEEGENYWLYGGYIFAMLGGIIGLFIGWYLWTYKKTIPDGRKVYAFSNKDRRHGRNIFIIGIIMLIFRIAVRFPTNL